MNPENWPKIKEIFDAALARPSQDRAAFLDQACDGDRSLRHEVESLLKSYGEAESFMEAPAVHSAAKSLVGNEHKLHVGQRTNQYEILGLIGEGGMGEVYLARDRNLGRNVAIKILPRYFTMDADRLRRFRDEARTASALNHPNVCVIHEIAETDDGRPFISMEYIEGVTLHEKIHVERTDLEKLLRYLQHVAEGLAKAHTAGVVHRDLKPDNIMITRDGHAKILDFGLAKLVRPVGGLTSQSATEVATAILQQRSTPGMIMGTIGYMSPEQAQSKTLIDQRSDIFSFGCILFEAITGQRAFQGVDAVDSLNKIIREPAPDLNTLNPSAPADLQRIVRRCLAKDPDERYQSIKEVAIELKEIRRGLTGSVAVNTTTTQATIESGTVATTTSTSGDHIVAGIKKHRLAVIVAAVLIVGVIAGIFLFFKGRNTAVAIDSIAVLPFENQNHDSDTDYLSDGVSESIINNLAQLPNLRVMARSSVFRYKGKQTDPLAVGKELGVRTVLTGRITQRGDNLIINTELLDVRDNRQLWGEQYNRKVADALAVQQDISREITDRLKLELTREEQKQWARRNTANPEAYQLYLKGRYAWNKRTPDGIMKSIEFYQQAIEKDPAYAAAYAGLADSYIVPADPLPPGEKYPRAKAAAKKALEIDPTLAEPHAALARAIFEYEWNATEAEREYRQAISINPNYATGHQYYSLFLVLTGRPEEAISEANRAVSLDPLSLSINATLGYVYMSALQNAEAQSQFKKILEIDNNFANAHDGLSDAYFQAGLNDQGVEEAIANLKLTSHESEAAALTTAYAASGIKGFWRKRLEQRLEEAKHGYVSPVQIAQLFARLDEKDNAFTWLEKAFRERAFGMHALLRGFPAFENLRSDPRFVDFVRRVGLTP